MSGPNRDQVRRLARWLSEASGVTVHAEYEGPRRRDGYGGWSLSWSAGPSREEMRRLTPATASGDGSALPLDAVHWRRGLGSDEQAAAATLAWLQAHPDKGDLLPHVDDDELPGRPDELPPHVRRRAAALAHAGWQPYTASPTARELHARAATGGWDAVAGWLDDLTEQQDADVVELRPRI